MIRYSIRNSESPKLYSNKPAVSIATVAATAVPASTRWRVRSRSGRSDINAEATTAGTNETFSMVDENGGSLMSGDTVYMQVRGGQYVSAHNGGGGDVYAPYFTPVTWERFVIEKTAGTGRIYSGNTVALRTWNGYYISAMNEGGGAVTALYRGVVTWEVFTVTF